MSEDLEKIRWRLEKLEDAHKEFKNEHDFLKKELQNISRIIFQIKWLVIGAIAYAATTELGVISVLKAVITA